MRFRREGSVLTVDTPAKLNLFLDVLGRRSDGYHELETVMVSIGLYDTLRFTPAATGELSLRSFPTRPLQNAPFPVDDSNLILCAARLLCEFTETTHGASIEIVKRIPMQAGMGGGSSDAAATLVGLNRLWNLSLDRNALHTLAAKLGSDVNFFLDSTPLALCRGRGEAIDPTPLRGPLWFVVAKPDTGLSTAAVFREWEATVSPQSSTPLLEQLRGGTTRREHLRCHNALQAPAEKLSDSVRTLLRQFQNCGATGAVMTGSGTACFSKVGSRTQGLRLASRLQAMSRCEVQVVRSGS